MADSNPYEPPQSILPAGRSANLKKLLIVLAIQFCLPGAAELLHQVVPASTWLLPVVAVHATCIGCALALMWPRWHWMLLTFLLSVAFWQLWLEAYLISQADFFAQFPDLNYTWAYYGSVLNAAVLASLMTLILAYHRQLIWQRTFVPDDPSNAVWRFTSRTLLYYSGIAALTVGTTVRLYDPESKDIWGIALGDLWMIGMTIILFMHLLQGSINCLSLGCCFVLMGILWFITYELIWSEFTPLHEAATFLGSFLGFCTLTVLLYRWAGFRIVPRRELT